MFQKIRRSLKDYKTRPTVETEQHVCHACGQNLRQPAGHGDDSVSRSYELYEPRDSGSWDGSGLSDSGYGSFSSSKTFGSLLQADGTPSDTFVQPPARRSTYTASIYSGEDDSEYQSQLDLAPETARARRPEYDHLLDMQPRSSSKSSGKWRHRSRYARLNELPAASPGTFQFQHDNISAFETGITQEETGPEKKRRTIHSLETLTLRPSSFKKLATRRTRHE